MSSVSDLGGFIGRIWQKWNIILLSMFSMVYSDLKTLLQALLCFRYLRISPYRGRRPSLLEDTKLQHKCLYTRPEFHSHINS